MSMVFALAAMGMWLSDRQKRNLLGFVVAPIAIGASLTINHYSPGIEAGPLQFFMHTCSITACIAYVWAVCTRLGREVPLKMWGVLLAVVLAFDVAGFWAESFLSTFFLINAACGIIFVTGAQLVAQASSRAVVDRAMLIVMVLVAAQFFLRPAVVVMIEAPTTALAYRESAGHALLILSGTILSLLQACAALATILSDRFADMQDRSARDPLTGLHLRRAFEDKAHDLLSKANDKGLPVSLIIGDIDHFKQVNDLWGHLAGDRAIASFGELIAETIRDTDRAGRIGGEEFCVLVWNCNETQAGGLAERLRMAFCARNHDGINDDIRLTASFGVAEVARGESYTSAFARADRALYSAKEAGRNRIVTADQSRPTDFAQQDLVAAIHPGRAAAA